jgi:beta-galactosidase/beta-glucuronidase
VPRTRVILVAGLGASTAAGVATAVLNGGDEPTTPTRAALPAQPYGSAGAIVLGRGWRYRADPRDRGLRLGWHRGTGRTRPVAMPSVPNAAPVSGPEGKRNYRGSVGWWFLRLRVTRGGHYAVRFASVNHYARVWLDGRSVGGHVGAYEPFEVRVRLRPGSSHLLAVRADWRFPELQRRRGWNRAWFNFGGVNRRVTLERIGRSQPARPRLWTGLRADGSAVVRVEVRVRNNAGRRRLRLDGTLSRGGSRVALRFPDAVVEPGRTHLFATRLTIRDPDLWSPERPALYELDLGVGSEGRVRARVGLRELSWRDGRLFLNGRRLILRGASIPPDARGHGDALTASDQDRIVAQLRYIGANATRAQQRLPEELLARLDAAGILVWQEIGPWDAAGDWTSTTPALQRRARQRAIDTFAEDQAHPSIVAWSLANELAGQGHSGGQAEHIQRLTRELHDLDPGRLVAVDLWGRHVPRYAGPLYRDLDAIGFTDYHGWYEAPGARGAALDALIRRRAETLHAIFPDKVLVATEFGAASNTRNRAAALGGLRYQSHVLSRHMRVYEDLDYVSGMLVWSLRDYALTPTFTGGSFARIAPDVRLTTGLNEKGLFDYAGRPKPAAAVVRRAFEDE